ncbi:hypothetical protein HDU93_009616, partial [Gonapodya sp. JEL0774]
MDGPETAPSQRQPMEAMTSPVESGSASQISELSPDSHMMVPEDTTASVASPPPPAFASPAVIPASVSAPTHELLFVTSTRIPNPSSQPAPLLAPQSSVELFSFDDDDDDGLPGDEDDSDDMEFVDFEDE